LSWGIRPLNATAQPMTAPAAFAMPSWRDLLYTLPRAPLGAHCDGGVVCTDMGTWGLHIRLTGTLLIQQGGSIAGGMLTPGTSFTAGGWAEGGAYFPILFGPAGTSPLVLPVLLFIKGAFSPPFWIGQHGAVFATVTLPYGPFSAPDAQGQPMGVQYEAGAAVSGHLLWMLHYDLSVSGQVSPGGPPPRLLAGLELRARFDGFTVFAQVLENAGICLGGSPGAACGTSVTGFMGVQIPLVVGHTSAAVGPTRGGTGQSGTTVQVTMGPSYDETTRAKYGDGIEAIQKLWQRLFNWVIDPYLDERCVLWDDDHKPMLDLGQKSKDGQYCERDGLRTPIWTHFDRDQRSTRVCYDKGLRNCILHRASEKDYWQVVPKEQQARRPYLDENCHVAEAGIPLPLAPVGIKSGDGQACEWENHRFPIGKQFWAMPGDGVMCLDATLLDCSLELPDNPMSTGQYTGSRFGQAMVRGAQKVLNGAERAPQVAEDLATGKLHVGTVADEALHTLKDGVDHLNSEDAKRKALDVAQAGKKWLDKPLHEKLGDVAELGGGAVIDLPVNMAVNAATAGAGTVLGGVATGVSDLGKAEKTVVKVEKAAGKAVKAEAEHVDREAAERLAIEAREREARLAQQRAEQAEGEAKEREARLAQQRDQQAAAEQANEQKAEELQRAKAKDRRAQEQARTKDEKYPNPDFEEEASEGWARWQSKEEEKVYGKDARRRLHDKKQKGDGDRSRRQYKEDRKDNE
jgi:hypothetical protein